MRQRRAQPKASTGAAEPGRSAPGGEEEPKERGAEPTATTGGRVAATRAPEAGRGGASEGEPSEARGNRGPSSRIAFFDLDKTLLAENSGSLWVRSELREGHLGYRMAAKATWWIFKYHLGQASMEHAVLEAIATLEGSQEQTLRERTWRFYEREVQQLYRPGGLQVLEQHRAAGDRLVLLTSASLYLSERVAEELRLDEVLCNRFEVVDEHFTGRPHGELCYGAGKLTHARASAERAGITLSDCSFYTDSTSDLSVLEQVGRPVCVHPDPRLRAIARRRDWPTVDWGRP